MSIYYKITILICTGQLFLLALLINNSLMIRTGYPHFLPQQTFELPAGIAIFVFNILIIFAVKNLYISSKELEQSKLDSFRMEQVEKQYIIQKQNQHDFKNHLNIIAGLAQKKDNQPLLDYLSNYIKHLEEEDHLEISTGTREIDILLYIKNKEALQKNVNLKISVQANLKPASEKIPTLISLISNLIDNATNASIGKTAAQNTVNIVFYQDPIDYTITIKNHLTPEQQNRLKEKLQKTPRTGGLAIIKKLSKKLSAVYQYNLNKDYLEAKIELPIHQIEN